MAAAALQQRQFRAFPLLAEVTSASLLVARPGAGANKNKYQSSLTFDTN